MPARSRQYRGMRVLFIVAMSLWLPTVATAAPDRLQFPFATLHAQDEDDRFETVTPGIFLTWDRPHVSLTAGLFRNSYGDGAFAFIGTWPVWEPGDWQVSLLGALAWYPNGSRFGLSVGNWVPGVGVEVRRDRLFANIFPSSDDPLDIVVTFGVTVPWEELSK